MGIQGIIGDVSSNIGNKITTFLENAWNAVNGITSNIGTFVADIWDGGFVGVKDFEALKAAVTEYSTKTQAVIDEYNVNADLDTALKGDAATALHEFVVSTKSLLDAYVKLVEKWNSELDEYMQNYQEGDSNLSDNVLQDAQDVAAAAENIDIG